MSEIPQAWSEVYDLVSDFLDGVVLAGGCLRDRDNGRAVKDLDFFYPPFSDKEPIWRLIPKLRQTHSIDRHRKLLGQADGADGDNSWDNGVISTLYFPSIDAALPDINLIEAKDAGMMAQLERFDFGICRIGYDGYHLHKTDEYLIDQELRAFTILADRRGEQLKRSYARFERISVRYRGWRLLDPAKLAREFAGVEERVEKAEVEVEVSWPPSGGGGGSGASTAMFSVPHGGTTVAYTIGAGGAGRGGSNTP
jgi:hypothetical protein